MTSFSGRLDEQPWCHQRGGRLSLWNIEDAERFVLSCITRSPLRIGGDELAELAAEGMVILLKLAAGYDPERDPRSGPGDKGFAGHATYLLGRKLSDAYHRLHPEYVAHVDEEGKRWYEYNDAPRSLNELLDQNNADADTDLSDGLNSDRTRTVGDFAV